MHITLQYADIYWQEINDTPAFDPTTAKKKKTSRKSVAFAGEDGEAVENSGEEDKSTADSHSLGTPTYVHQSTDSHQQPTNIHPAAAAEDGDEPTEDKPKKKKKKKVSADGEEANGDGEFDASALKKKKKKKAPKVDADSFDAELEKAGIAPKEGDEAEAVEEEELKVEDAGDLILGTGVWNSTSTVDLTYPMLLTRFFTLLRDQHPDLAGDGRKSYKIPPPQVLREGNKKTIFANISDICKRMKRHDEHVTQFLFAELGTSGSVDGSKRLVIRGKFQQKQLENVLRRYICKPFPFTIFSSLSLLTHRHSGIRYMSDM